MPRICDFTRLHSSVPLTMFMDKLWGGNVIPSFPLLQSLSTLSLISALSSPHSPLHSLSTLHGMLGRGECPSKRSQEKGPSVYRYISVPQSTTQPSLPLYVLEGMCCII